MRFVGGFLRVYTVHLHFCPALSLWWDLVWLVPTGLHFHFSLAVGCSRCYNNNNDNNNIGGFI